MTDNKTNMYMVTCNTTSKKYVGQTKESIERRWRRHVLDKDKKQCCRLLAKAILENGESNFTIENLIVCDDDQSDYYEKHFISLYNTIHPNGFNLTTGGKTGYDFCDETKRIISEGLMGHIISDKTKIKIGNSNKFNVHSDEAKKKMKQQKSRRKNPEVLLNALEKLNLEELPKYICFESSIETVIVKVPNQKSKQFGDKSVKLEDRIQNAIDYKNSLIDDDGDATSTYKVLDDKDKQRLFGILKSLGLENLPIYMYYNIINDSDRVTVKIPGKKEKSFSKKEMSLKTKLRLAIEYKDSLQSLTDIGQRDVTVSMKA